MTDAASTLNAQQTLFLSCYLGEANRNATRAAEMAGYKHPRQAGARLLSKRVIRDEIARWSADVLRFGIAQRDKRIEELDDLKNRHLQVIRERAEAYSNETAPGARTGLLVRQERVIGSGDTAEKIVEFRLDEAVTDAVLKLHAQVAKELGQWTDKVDVGGDFLQALREFGREPA